MQAIILAGGYGTRLRPITDTIPKPLLPLGKKTVIELLIDHCIRNDFENIIITLNYKAEMIKNYLKERGYTLVYSIEKEPLGTAGCIKNIGKMLEDNFVVLSGDNYTKQNLRNLMNFHKRKKAIMTLALIKPRDPRDYAVVKVDKYKTVLRFQEKPKGRIFSRLTTCGTYVMNNDLLRFIPTSKKFDISYDLIPLLLRNKMKIYGKIMNDFWEDIGTIERYQKVVRIIKN